MKKRLVVCGDSFNYGIGCTNLYTNPYGPLVAKHFDWECIRLARGSASNYVTHLQGNYASTMDPKPHLVILGITSYDRMEWLAEGKKLNESPKLEDVNYHLYPPHLFTEPHHSEPMPFYLKDKEEYDPKILSEQVLAFDDYINLYKYADKNGKVDGIAAGINWFKRMHSEPIEKIELMYNYYMSIMDSRIKRDYDTGVIMKTYLQIKKQGINCIILSPDIGYKDFVHSPHDFFYQPWGELSAKWPTICHHAGDGGHEDTANRLVDHIKTYGFV